MLHMLFYAGVLTGTILAVIGVARWRRDRR
jgi:hypothetical protein